MKVVKKCVMAECDYYKEYGECSSVCERYLIKPVLTNYDRVRNMSIDEMARFIPDWSYTKACKCDEETYADCNNECWKCVREWLESEVE
jgi:hypothetical protein